MRGHDKTHVEFMDMKAEIDTEIAGLIESIWQAGLATVMSCQDAPQGWVWIQFATEVHAATFLSIMVAHESEAEGLCKRIHPTQDHADGDLPDGMWQYDFWPESFPVPQTNVTDGVVDELPGKPSFVRLLLTSVRFPPHDLPEVEKRLRRHNQTVRGKVAVAIQIDYWLQELRAMFETQSDHRSGNLREG